MPPVLQFVAAADPFERFGGGRRTVLVLCSRERECAIHDTGFENPGIVNTFWKPRFDTPSCGSLRQLIPNIPDAEPDWC